MLQFVDDTLFELDQGQKVDEVGVWEQSEWQMEI